MIHMDPTRISGQIKIVQVHWRCCRDLERKFKDRSIIIHCQGNLSPSRKEIWKGYHLRVQYFVQVSCKRKLRLIVKLLILLHSLLNCCAKQWVLSNLECHCWVRSNRLTLFLEWMTISNAKVDTSPRATTIIFRNTQYLEKLVKAVSALSISQKETKQTT